MNLKEIVRFSYLNIRNFFLPAQKKSIGYYRYGKDIGSSWVVQQSMDVLIKRGWIVKDWGSECEIILVRNTENEFLLKHLKKLKKQGKFIVYYLAETRSPIDNENDICVQCWELADSIIVNSVGYLEHPNYKWWQGKEVIIEESYPNSFDKSVCKKHTDSGDPKIVWHGFSHKIPSVIYGDTIDYDKIEYKLDYPFLGNLYDLLPASISLISKPYDGPLKEYQGIVPEIIHPGYPGIFKELIKFDIGIAPYALWAPSAHARPINKVAMYMLVGLPVIVVGIPEYKKWIKHKETGMIANTPEEWVEAVEYLKDPIQRERIGLNGRKLMLDNINPSIIADKWEKELNKFYKEKRC